MSLKSPSSLTDHELLKLIKETKLEIEIETNYMLLVLIREKLGMLLAEKERRDI